MTVNQVWLALVLVVSHTSIVQLVLVPDPSPFEVEIAIAKLTWSQKADDCDTDHYLVAEN
jgi:hypothetical protein